MRCHLLSLVMMRQLWIKAAPDSRAVNWLAVPMARLDHSRLSVSSARGGSGEAGSSVLGDGGVFAGP